MHCLSNGQTPCESDSAKARVDQAKIPASLFSTESLGADASFEAWRQGARSSTGWSHRSAALPNISASSGCADASQISCRRGMHTGRSPTSHIAGASPIRFPSPRRSSNVSAARRRKRARPACRASGRNAVRMAGAPRCSNSGLPISPETKLRAGGYAARPCSDPATCQAPFETWSRNSARCRGGEVDLLLVDGAFALYLWVVKLIEPRLKVGAVILGENAFEPGYLEYVRDPRERIYLATAPARRGPWQ